MKTTQTTRRNFLSNIALLSAGVAVGPLGSYLPMMPTADLEQQWRQFCQKNGGLLAGGDAEITAAELQPSKGHFHKNGTMVHFPNAALLAQPTWVFWQERQKSPADIIVTFYSSNGEKKKVFRLNRFELEALNKLPETNSGKETLARLKEAAQNGSLAQCKNAPLLVKATVRKSRPVHIQTTVFDDVTATEKQLINHA